MKLLKMRLLKLYKNPLFYLKYFLRFYSENILNSLKPYKIEINDKTFFVKYTPFWKAVKMGTWEPDTFLVFDRFIDKEHSFIDIGAWIGPTTLYGSQIAKCCYAIEPDPVAFKNLKKNIVLNPTLKSKVKLYDYCISDKPGTTKFWNPVAMGNSGSSILFAESKKSIVVKSITLQNFTDSNKINNCNFIKIDIEGGETLVLPNIKSFLEKNKPTLYLSLHPTVFKNIKKDYTIIQDTLKIYKNIYDSKGKTLSLNQLYSEFIQKKVNCEIVATDMSW
jgi:FkbM family methyltransferase